MIVCLKQREALAVVEFAVNFQRIESNSPLYDIFAPVEDESDEGSTYLDMIDVALTEFSVHYEDADSELSQEVWQLTASRLVDHDVGPDEAVDALEIG